MAQSLINFIEKNINYRGPHLWNELAHDHFSKLDSLPLFHKKIKEFILMFHDRSD